MPDGLGLQKRRHAVEGRARGQVFHPGPSDALQVVRGRHLQVASQVGVKPAGGIRSSKDAITYLVMVNETAGPDWLTPDWFRFGASSLLNDLLMQRTKMATGRYSGADYFTLD